MASFCPQQTQRSSSNSFFLIVFLSFTTLFYYYSSSLPTSSFSLPSDRPYISIPTTNNPHPIEIDPAGNPNVASSIDTSKSYDLCSIGAGFSGVIFAERSAQILKHKTLVIDNRLHFGGNTYDHIDAKTGVLMNKYGAHLFHTNSEKAWHYLNMFEARAPKWERWDHEVVGWVKGKLIPIPVNINTVNRLFNAAIRNEDEMKEWLKKVQVPCDEKTGCKNAEEMAKSRVGEGLFKEIFADYTLKQWDKEAKDLDPLVTARIPVTSSFDPRYFKDKYQALPSQGYTKWFSGVLNHPNIDVVLGVDYFKHKAHLDQACKKIIYTGPIDRYFKDDGLDKLEYRGIDFEIQRHFNVNGYILPNSVVNYPGPEVKFTRIVEYRHMLNQDTPHTVTVKEYSKDMGPNDDPYYPVPNPRNLALYAQYQALAEKEEQKTRGKVIFVGRLANYKYFNMDAAIVNALDSWYDAFGQPDVVDMKGFFGAGSVEEEGGQGFVAGTKRKKRVEDKQEGNALQ